MLLYSLIIEGGVYIYFSLYCGHHLCKGNRMEIVSILPGALLGILLACMVAIGFVLYGLPLCVSLYGLWPTSSDRVFKHRFAKHSLLFAAFIQIVVLLLVGGVLAVMMNDVSDPFEASRDPLLLAQIIVCVLLALCALCAILLVRFKTPWWFTLLLALFWVACQTIFLMLLDACMKPIETNNVNIVEDMLYALRYGVFVVPEFFEPEQWWFFRARLFLFASMSASAMSLIWLIFRRNRDDFGRDYYAYAARVAARFALITSVVSSLGYIVVLSVYPHLMQSSPMFEGSRLSISFVVWTGVAIQSLGALLWFLVQASATPMRHKIAIVCGGLCVMCATLLWFVAPLFLLAVN